MKFMISETFTNSETFFLQIHKCLRIRKISRTDIEHAPILYSHDIER